MPACLGWVTECCTCLVDIEGWHQGARRAYSCMSFSASGGSELVPRIRAGDSPAFARLYELYFEQLWQFAYRYVRSETLAEEVVHDVFLNLWRARESWQVRTSVQSYLYGAVRNRALTLSAQAATSQAHEDDDELPAPVSPPSPAAQLESAELEEMVQRAVDALPERQKLVMTLRLTREMTYAEIASAIGVSEAAVGKLMLKAQARLRSALGSYMDRGG